jgi:hypothetical protein
MKISKLALIALLGGALMAFGCSDDNPPPDGTGGTGGGEGGSGGMAGAGGGGGGGGGDGVCEATEDRCENGTIDPTDENCMPALPTPPTADVCTGSESLMNPASCTTTGTVVTHRLTAASIFPDCNGGYDLDGCDGNSCRLGTLAPDEGVGGVDNALAGLAPVLVGVGGNLDGVNQAFYDALCTGDLDIQLNVDANLEEGCATVELVSGGMAVDTILLNVGALTDGAVCASGTIGDLPISIVGGDPPMVAEGAIANAVLRVSITPDAGFSNGTLGGTVDQATAAAIADLLIDGGSAVVAQVLDINAALEGDTSAACNALSLTLTIGGVVPEAAQ